MYAINYSLSIKTNQLYQGPLPQKTISVALINLTTSPSSPSPPPPTASLNMRDPRSPQPKRLFSNTQVTADDEQQYYYEQSSNSRRHSNSQQEQQPPRFNSWDEEEEESQGPKMSLLEAKAEALERKGQALMHRLKKYGTSSSVLLHCTAWDHQQQESNPLTRLSPSLPTHTIIHRFR
jgi:hypothetical protein